MSAVTSEEKAREIAEKIVNDCRAPRRSTRQAVSHDEPRLIDAIAKALADRPVEDGERLREALTPSADTKAAYIGEFKFPHQQWNAEGDDTETIEITVPWTTIKEIMAAIRARAALAASSPNRTAAAAPLPPASTRGVSGEA